MHADPPMPIYGPEPFPAPPGAPGAWTHWDVWMCLVAERDFGGDLGRLADAIVIATPSYASTIRWERLTSHLDDLAVRLPERGLAVAELASWASHDPKLLAKARRKILHQDLSGRDLTPAMRDTPRRRLRTRALFGAWPSFPVSPDGAYADFAAEIEQRDWYGETATLHLAGRLVRLAARLDERARGDPASRLALWRALVSAGYEAFARCDDSSGELGRLVGAAVETYTGIGWQVTPIDRGVYYRDLCELLVWEEYGVLFERERRAFRRVPRRDAERVAAILQELADEHGRARLFHQRDEAHELVAWLYLATRRIESFPAAAELIGSEAWRPIEEMARAALDTGRVEIARRVFTAADRPGFHRERLRESALRMLDGVRPTLHVARNPR